jgi:hypothetical protein
MYNLLLALRCDTELKVLHNTHLQSFTDKIKPINDTDKNKKTKPKCDALCECHDLIQPV